MKKIISNYFQFDQNQTNLKTEIIAGITTFLTAAYIIFVNPAILSQAGMNFGSVFVATCLAGAFGSLLMGLYANYPILVAPTMGSNAYFTYMVVQKMGLSWQVALGAVFFSGVLFLILTITKLRQYVIDALPYSMKVSIAAGIGFFLGLLALKNAGIVVGNPETLLQLGIITQKSAWLCFLGFCLIVALDYKKIPGAIMLGILVITLIGTLFHIVPYKGIVSLPPSITPTLLQLDFKTFLHVGVIVSLLTFFFAAFFDATGTLIAIATEMGLVEKNGKVKNLDRALQSDSIAIMFGALLGTSTSGAYIESATGVRSGGRTGFTAVVIGILFIFALLLSPLAQMIPSYATAAALLFVACIMAQGMANIDWKNISESAPAVITALAIPLSFSITDGISLGFISYVLIKLLSGQFRKINFVTILLALACGIYLLSL